MDLHFARDAGHRTYLARQFVRYPFHVCRPHYDDGQPVACSLALQSLSGGLFEHDDVAIRLRAAAGARVRVATAASTIVHAMTGGHAAQAQTLAAGRGAWLEYLPEPQILFPGSRLLSRTSVEIDPEATVIACEMFLAHDPTQGGRSFDAFDARIDVVRTGAGLLTRERCLVDGASWREGRVGVSNAHGIHASLWILGSWTGADAQARLRAVVDASTERGERLYAGVSSLPNGAGLQLRALGDDVVALKQLIGEAVAAARAAGAANGA